MRGDHVVIEIDVQAVARDVRAAGGVLGGGPADRVFFWTLALAVGVRRRRPGVRGRARGPGRARTAP
ncbi:MAG: hypothetical protein MUE51_07425 [Thermoleophilia bacterium]|jgi:hypothetical protein|nr:hypothetical protein [Thermoleophilia bacterium]